MGKPFSHLTTEYPQFAHWMLGVANPSYSVVFHKADTVSLIFRVELLSTLQAIKLLSRRDLLTDKQTKTEDSGRRETPIHFGSWAALNRSYEKEWCMKSQEKMVVISCWWCFIVGFANFQKKAAFSEKVGSVWRTRNQTGILARS